MASADGGLGKAVQPGGLAVTPQSCRWAVAGGTPGGMLWPTGGQWCWQDNHIQHAHRYGCKRLVLNGAGKTTTFNMLTGMAVSTRSHDTL